MKRSDQDTAYEKFLKSLSVVEIRLVNSSCRLDTAAEKKIRSGKAPEPVRRFVSSEYRLADVGTDFFNAAVEFSFTIEGRKTKVKPVVIECCFEGHFHNRLSIDKSMAERFAEFDFRLIIWPYLRQFVHDMTARMSIRPVVIPFLSDETIESKDKRKGTGSK